MHGMLDNGDYVNLTVEIPAAEALGSRAVLRAVPVAAILVFALATPAGSAGGGSARDTHQAKRFQTCMRVGSECGRRVEEGDIPYASFRDRSGRRPRVRVCVRDRDGRYCLARRRPARPYALLYQPVLYKNIGVQVTTWRVKGRVVGRWRWRVVPE
jgi:hypothetical protein